MPLTDRYDGITIGTLATERWIEKNAVMSILLGKAYFTAYRSDLDAQDAGLGIKNMGVDDASNVYEIVAPPYNRRGGIDVNVQDQTSPVVISKMTKLNFEGATINEATIETRTIDVGAGIIANFAVEDFVTIFNVAAARFYQSKVVSILGNVLTLDTPFDYTYPIGSVITSASTNMGVDGSVTPVIFGIRNTVDRIPVEFDVTRIIFTCIATSAVDLVKFANITALINGIVLRRNDGTITNYFNAKSNKELAALMYDFTVHAATNPQQGQDGFVARMTFAGQNKMGVTIRLGEDEDLQMIIQDNLSTITLLEVTAEGHLVED